jgi:hypothetical protein
MPAIFISQQEAKEIIDVLEYAERFAIDEADRYPDYDEPKKFSKMVTRLIVEIKRRLRK